MRGTAMPKGAKHKDGCVAATLEFGLPVPAPLSGVGSVPALPRVPPLIAQRKKHVVVVKGGQFTLAE